MGVMDTHCAGHIPLCSLFRYKMIKLLVTVVLSLNAGAEFCQAQAMLKVIVGVKLELKLKLITISFEDGLVS